MRTIKVLTICIILFSFMTGCVVTKKSYTNLLNELTAVDIEKRDIERKFEKSRAENDKKISEQKNRISKIEQELKDLQAKSDDDKNVAASRQAELTSSLEVLKEQSSEETKKLLAQISELQKKYDENIAEKNEAIDTLKEDHRNKIESLNNELDREKQASKLMVEDLKEQIETLEALTSEQEKALNALSVQADQIENQLKEEIEKGEITLKRYKTKTIINIDNSILFDSGTAYLKQPVKKSLNKIAKALSDFPDNNIQIEGHTDDVPINTKVFPSNWELSSARALAVLRYFADGTDLDPRRLSAAGLGEYHPLVPNDSKENKRLNRRVDIVIIPK